MLTKVKETEKHKRRFLPMTATNKHSQCSWSIHTLCPEKNVHIFFFRITPVKKSLNFGVFSSQGKIIRQPASIRLYLGYHWMKPV